MLEQQSMFRKCDFCTADGDFVCVGMEQTGNFICHIFTLQCISRIYEYKPCKNRVVLIPSSLSASEEFRNEAVLEINVVGFEIFSLKYFCAGLAEELTFFSAVPMVLWFAVVARSLLRTHWLVWAVAETVLAECQGFLPFAPCPKKKK